MKRSRAYPVHWSRRLAGLCSILALTSWLAACASRPPAPVEHRTRPAGEAPIAAQRPPSPVAEPRKPPPSARPVPDRVPEAPVAQTAPVRSSGIEVRPLTAPNTVPSAPTSPGPGALRREPKVAKRPYSEALLAELKSADPSARPESATRADATRPEAPVPIAAKPPVSAANPGSPVAANPASGPAMNPASTPTSPPASPPTSPPTSPPAAAPVAPVASAAPGSTPPTAPPADGAIEFAWPIKGKITQTFGESRSTGISIAAPAGDPIQAAADGKIIFSGQGPRGYGNLIIVKHDADTLSVYGHNRALLVKEGQSVRKGQRIAEAGDSGADLPKFLFEIRKAGKPVDPLKFLPPR